MMPGHEKRVLSLDGLRGIAALIVFLYHVDIMVKPFGAGGVRASSLAPRRLWCSSSCLA